jgi:hypothetical protein
LVPKLPQTRLEAAQQPRQSNSDVKREPGGGEGWPPRAFDHRSCKECGALRVNFLLGAKLLRRSPLAGGPFGDGGSFFFRSGPGAGGAAAGDCDRCVSVGYLGPYKAQAQRQRGTSVTAHGWPLGMNSCFGVHCTWGNVIANETGWPELDGKYVNYPWFQKEWRAEMRTCHEMAGDSLVVKRLNDKGSVQNANS